MAGQVTLLDDPKDFNLIVRMVITVTFVPVNKQMSGGSRQNMGIATFLRPFESGITN